MYDYYMDVTLCVEVQRLHILLGKYIMPPNKTISQEAIRWISLTYAFNTLMRCIIGCFNRNSALYYQTLHCNIIRTRNLLKQQIIPDI